MSQSRLQLPTFYRVNGNFKEILTRLYLPKEWKDAVLQGGGDAIVQMKKDFPRINFHFDDLELVDVKRQILKDYSDGRTKDYVQNQFTGRIVGESFVRNKNQKWFLEGLVAAPSAKEHGPFMAGLETVFKNDDGVLCGVSIDYIRDDSSTEEVVKDRPLLYTVTIIEDVTAAPEDRRVSCFVQADLWNKLRSEEDPLSLSDEVLEPSEMLLGMNQVLGSEKMTQLFDGLFVNGQLSSTKFTELNESFEKTRDYRELMDSFIYKRKILDSYASQRPVLYQKATRLYDEIESILREKCHYDASEFELLKDVLEDSNTFLCAPVTSSFSALTGYAQKLEENLHWGMRLAEALRDYVAVQDIQQTALPNYKNAVASHMTQQPDLYQKGMELCAALEAILHKPQGIEANKMDVLRSILENSQVFLRDPRDPAAKTSLAVLAGHSEQLNKETHLLWKRLGAALLGLVGVGLVLVGVLATIPTGPLGIAVIAAGVALIAGGTTLATTTSLSKERKLAHALTLFHSSATTVEKTVDVINPLDPCLKVKRAQDYQDLDSESDAFETPTSAAQSPSSKA